MHLPKRPAEFDLPRLPINLTDLDDNALMTLMAKLTRYQDHISGLHVLAEINEGEAATMLELAKARYITGQWTGESSDRITIIKAEGTLDPEVIKIDAEYRQLKAHRKVYAVMMDALQRDAAVASRELSRRIGRAPNEARVDRHG